MHAVNLFVTSVNLYYVELLKIVPDVILDTTLKSERGSWFRFILLIFGKKFIDVFMEVFLDVFPSNTLFFIFTFDYGKISCFVN